MLPSFFVGYGEKIMIHPVCFYIPALHRISVPLGLSPHILALPCEQALHGPRYTARADALLTEGGRAAVAEFCRALPLSPPEARAALEEMMRLGGTTADNAFLASIRQDEAAAQALDQKEKREIDSFAGSGAAPAHGNALAEVDAERQRHARIDSQKILLLAYELEAHTRAIAELEQTIAEAGRSLQAHLADGESPEAEAEDALPLAAPVPLQPGQETGISWRLVLEAALAFAPPASIFYTQDPRMAADLAALGPLLPLTAEEAARYACSSLPSTDIRQIRLPGWQLAGRRAAEPHRPWLHAPVTLLVSAPSGVAGGISGGAA